ncbi:DUF3089 domain-containing protein [Novosphingobium sp.]|uniref:DUF3089 domain-containing protein n=1 Tax=Novosphingobium sp. TaxID=1874826 RepID=UPI0025DD280F|nr:DUF3089 domain-containing protein [Novosphingobium sp.]MCC6924509.1 DUF3089 domain-containing protein [Novosphingobium sp.]
MVRKFLYFIAIMVVLFAAGRIVLGFYPEELTRATFTPSGAFEPQQRLAQNAYAAPAMWLARPRDPGEALIAWKPDGFAEPGAPIDVAVFFVHPTSYLKKTHWNAPLDDADARRIGEIVTRANASVFNRAAEVWAPRYRQATFGAFVSDKPEAGQAHDLAYRDVAQAFDTFLAAQPPGRGIVLAGHSQGSFIIKRLLKEKVAGTPLAQRIVAAYAIGWLVDTARDLPAMGLTACATPEQSGCVISYLSFVDQADTTMMRGAYERFAGKTQAPSTPHYLCSNPLTGGIGGTAAADANRGAIVPDLKMEHATITPKLVGATCAADGTLRIGEGPDMGPFVLPGGNYHVYDYALFWTNLREDFARRAAAWQKQR